MKPLVTSTVLMLALALALATGAGAEESNTVTVNCAKATGKMKGLYQGFSGGFALLAKTESVKPCAEEIGASLYRKPIFSGGSVFTGKTLEDAQNPAMYDFSDMDSSTRKVQDLGMKLFATVAHVPPQLSADGTPKGAVRGDNLQVFAEVVKHTVLHLTQGWANGFEYAAPYWEIWNEPDLASRPDVGSTFYTGAQEDLFNLYAAVSRALKTIKPLPGQAEIKVGGPAFAHLKDWHEPFLAYCDANELPLDFFSFHHYDDNPEGFVQIIEKANAAVRKYPRFASTELILDEWNMAVGPWGEVPKDLKGMDMVFYVISNPKFSEPIGATHLTRSLILMERSPLTMATHFLLADNGVAQMGVMTCPEIPLPARPKGMPAPTDMGCKPKLKFYALKAFNELYKTPELVDVGIQGETVDGMAGLSANKDRLTLLLVNWGERRQFQTKIADIPWAQSDDREFSWTQQLINQESFEQGEPLKKVADGAGKGSTLEVAIDIPAQSIVLLILTAK